MTTGAAILSTSFGLSGLILGTFLSSGRLWQALCGFAVAMLVSLAWLLIQTGPDWPGFQATRVLGVLWPMPVGLAIGSVLGWARSREGRE